MSAARSHDPQPRTQRLLLASCVLSMLAYGVAARSPTYLGLAAIAFTVAWAWGSLGPGRRAPRWLVHTALGGVVLWGLTRGYVSGLSVDLFCQFLTVLLCIRVLDRGRVREDGQALAVAVFLAIGAMLTDVSVWLGLTLLALVPVTAAAALDHQIAAARAVTPSVRPAHGARAPRDRSASIALATVLGLGVSAVVFVLLPRGLGERAFGRFGAGISGVEVGFTDNVQLGGGGGVISENPAPVLDAGIYNRDGKNIGSAGRVLYLRGAVLDVYSGGSWSSGGLVRALQQERAARDRWVAVSDLLQRDFIRWDTELRVTFRERDGIESAVFTLWEPVEVRFPSSTDIDVNPATGIVQFAGGAPRGAYSVRSQADRGGGAPWSQGRVTRRPGVTFDSPVVAGVARSILEAAEIEPDPALRPPSADFHAARAIEQHLRSRFTYTLENRPVPPGQDPIEWFLTDERTGQRGHCEYFAAAMTALCRSVGIPARVVTGYVGTEFNELTGLYLIRRSNAHAWVEVQTASGLLLPMGRERSSGAWQTFDPTPPAEFRRVHEPKTGALASARRLLEAVEYAWIRGVVSFDAQRRRELLGDLAEPAWAERLDEHIDERVGRRPSGRRLLLASVVALAAGAAVVGGGVLAMGLRRRRSADGSAAGGDDRAAWGRRWRIYRRLRRAAARAGAPADPGVPLRARLGSAGWPDEATRLEASEAAELLYRGRFSGSDPAPGDLTRADELSRRLMRAVR